MATRKVGTGRAGRPGECCAKIFHYPIYKFAGNALAAGRFSDDRRCLVRTLILHAALGP
ncbi:hypothetical protein PATSB16_39140 [Pandoraea thiooxydans]|nr:hypothetical protein PATSB16_39140 [Pandoraea thiooxydans]